MTTHCMSPFVALVTEHHVSGLPPKARHRLPSSWNTRSAAPFGEARCCPGISCCPGSSRRAGGVASTSSTSALPPSAPSLPSTALHGLAAVADEFPAPLPCDPSFPGRPVYTLGQSPGLPGSIEPATSAMPIDGPPLPP